MKNETQRLALETIQPKREITNSTVCKQCLDKAASKDHQAALRLLDLFKTMK